jgi:hypothetical protein
LPRKLASEDDPNRQSEAGVECSGMPQVPQWTKGVDQG